MGLHRHLSKTVLTLCKFAENLKPKVPTQARSAVAAIQSQGLATAFNQNTQNKYGAQVVTKPSLLHHASQSTSIQSQNPLSKTYVQSVRLSQFVFKYTEQLSCSSRPNDTSSQNNRSLSFSGQSEKEAKLCIAYLTPSLPAQAKNCKTSVFQPVTLTPFRSGCGTPIITHRAMFQHSPHLASVCRLKHTKPQVPPTKIAKVYDYEGAITDEQAAHEFVFALKTSERQHLYTELAKYQSLDPNGSQTSPPTRKQLQQVVLHQTFPFLGFGFLDNFLMIVAGEYIDVTLGAAFGISTMAAAALGNLISDVGGLGSAHYVETVAARVGVRNPHLSPEQVEMRRTKWASNLGKFIGVTIGCLLGMFPLLFFPKKNSEAKEDEEKAQTTCVKEEKVTEKN
ncbi:hypothetical protein EGW08_014471 [Elysia chlorotica]|uniref:Transmembrane protein 65 n=1 Tax=Elysia chlorotica TaxID=188477 RepID=A0A433T8A8_ELYCH|nr:hypothetical protein EGW08_014471 [Elysia chlorotica]